MHAGGAREGIIRRDLKPANIVDAGTDGCLKVLDFGLAKVVEAVSLAFTHSGVIVGTAAYMAPEQTHRMAGGPERPPLRFRASEVRPSSQIRSNMSRLP